MKGFKRTRKDGNAEKRSTALIAGATVGATVFVFGALGLGLLLGAPRLQERLSANVQRPRVVFTWPALSTPGADKKQPANAPTWVPPSVQDELLAAAQREIDKAPDPFSADGLRRIAESAAGSGWFEQITAVRREPDGIIRVAGQWRTPAAVIRKDNDYVVARKGEVLPLAYERGAAPLKAIIGVRQDASKAAGRVIPGLSWPGADVQAGLDLLSMLAGRPWAAQVAAVDVSGYTSGRQLVIVTTSGGRIVWGGAPTDAIPGQVSAEIKLKRLDVLQHQFGAIDARHRIVEVAGPRTLVDDSVTANAS